jgi:hypothetical protein
MGAAVNAVRDWLDSTFTLAELLSLTDNELAQLEEKEGSLALAAAWWRRRRREATYCPECGRQLTFGEGEGIR